MKLKSGVWQTASSIIIGGGLLAFVFTIAYNDLLKKPDFSTTQVIGSLNEEGLLATTITLHNTGPILTLFPVPATATNLQLRITSDHVISDATILDSMHDGNIDVSQNSRDVVFTIPRVVKYQQVQLAFNIQPAYTNDTFSSLLLRTQLTFDEDRIIENSYRFENGELRSQELSENLKIWEDVLLFLMAVGGISYLLMGYMYWKMIQWVKGGIVSYLQNRPLAKWEFQWTKKHLKAQIETIVRTISSDSTTDRELIIGVFSLKRLKKTVDVLDKMNLGQISAIESLHLEISKRDFDIKNSNITSDKLLAINKNCLSLANLSLQQINKLNYLK